jgi:hypothetical protein
MMKGAIVVDPIGDSATTDDEQVATLTGLFEKIFTNVKFARYSHPWDIGPGIRVLLFDYGAAGLLLEGQVASNIRGMLHWCEDNPEGLVIVVSAFSWSTIQEDFDKEVDGPRNMILWNRDKIPSWFEGSVEKKWRAAA